MSYRVIYHPELEKVLPVEKVPNKHGEELWVLGIAIVIFIVFLGVSVGSADKLKDLAELYDLDAFAGSLRQGEKFTQAFTDFCLEVLRHGSLL